jgi:hypothetical protein
MQPAISTAAAISPPRMGIEWLARNCYIEFACEHHEDQEYWNSDSLREEPNEDEDSVISYRICE